MTQWRESGEGGSDHGAGRTDFGNEMEVVEDIIFERGYSSPYFITNAETQIIKLENVVILLVGKKSPLSNRLSLY